VTYDILPEDFKDIRSRTGMTQPEFADAIGVTLASVKAYEYGQGIPSYQVLKTICDVADVEFRITKDKTHPLTEKRKS